MQYNLGLVSVSFRPFAPEAILKAVAGAGLTCIEWGSDVHAPYKDLEKLNAIAALQKQYGITCCSYGTYFRLGETPMEELPGYIAAAKILGTDILRLWCGTKSGSKMTPEEKKNLIDQCRKAAAIAAERGVILCMECHRSTLTEDCNDAVALMKAVDSPHFRMYWQPFQWQTYEENLINAEKIAPYAKHIHVFNWTEMEKFPLSLAVNQWRDYLTRFTGERALLLEFMPQGTLEELTVEADALRQIAEE